MSSFFDNKARARQAAEASSSKIKTATTTKEDADSHKPWVGKKYGVFMWIKPSEIESNRQQQAEDFRRREEPRACYTDLATNGPGLKSVGFLNLHLNEKYFTTSFDTLANLLKPASVVVWSTWDRQDKHRTGFSQRSLRP